MNLYDLVLLIKNESDEEKLNNLKNDLLYMEIDNIRSLSSSFENRGILPEDLFQEACLEVLSALETFDHHKSKDFKSFYTKHVKNKLEKLVKEEEEGQSEYLEIVNELNRLIDTERKLKSTLRRNPTHEEIMEDMKISHEELHNLIEFAFDILKAEDETIEYTEDTLISDLIDRYSDKDRQLEIEESKELVESSLDVLNENERNIISLLFGLDGDSPKSIDDVAKMYHVSTERIRQIRDLSIRKMKDN